MAKVLVPQKKEVVGPGCRFSLIPCFVCIGLLGSGNTSVTYNDTIKGNPSVAMVQFW
uniref:Uncharacterized protein n=1 Tax=Anguilla anguilla TaxID=7936 RepID=A0A0E9XU07_ANGAN